METRRIEVLAEEGGHTERIQLCALCGQHSWGAFYAVPTGVVLQESCKRCFLLRQVYSLLSEAGGPYQTSLTLATLETVYDALYRDRVAQIQSGLLRPTTFYPAPPAVNATGCLVPEAFPPPPPPEAAGPGQAAGPQR